MLSPLGISGNDHRLYPLAGGSRGGAANSVRAVAGAGAVIFYDWVGAGHSVCAGGVGVAATGYAELVGVCVVLSLSDFRLARSSSLSIGGGQPRWRGEIRCAPSPVLSFFMIGSALAAASELGGQHRRDRLAPGR